MKWVGIVFMTTVIIGGFFVWKWKSSSQVSYKDYLVTRGKLEIVILSTGTVLPENRLEIKAPIAGRIDTVLVDEGKYVHKSQILAWMSSTERAALLDAARAQGNEEVKRWEELYKPTPVMAPLPGTIIFRNVEPGQTITVNDAIFAMSDRLTVKAQVDETDIAKIKLHQKAVIVLDAYPDKEIEASVDQIAFEAKTVNNVTTYIVNVLPKMAPDFFRSGMTANVRFLQENKQNILLLSAEAIIYSDGMTMVMIRSPGGAIQEKVIKTGLSDGKRTEVISGLTEGDIVVRADLTKNTQSTSSNPFSPFSGRRPSKGSGGHP